jgi:hypothetical protein
MATSSLDELKGKVAAGEYAIDSGMLAGTILTDFALVRRVGRTLRSEDGDATAGEGGLAPQPPSRRRGERRGPQPLKPRRERRQ